MFVDKMVKIGIINTREKDKKNSLLTMVVGVDSINKIIDFEFHWKRYYYERIKKRIICKII